MPDIATILPPRRPDLPLRALDEQGEYVDVVKDPRTGAFDEEEDVLPCQLDDARDALAICRAFTERFAGPLSEEARKMTRHPGLWVVEFTNVALVLGIVWNMTQKPSTGTAIMCLLIAYAVGLGVALRFMRAPADASVVVTEPTA